MNKRFVVNMEFNMDSTTELYTESNYVRLISLFSHCVEWLTNQDCCK